jgi:hypothetical protein
MMGDQQSNAVLPPRCTVCEFPDWNKKITGNAGPREISSSERTIEKYENLQISIQSNCPGCILLHEAWAYCIPDERTRSGAWMTFNVDTTKMYFHLFHEGVHDIDIFTLPSTFYHPYVGLGIISNKSQINLASSISLALL